MFTNKVKKIIFLCFFSITIIILLFGIVDVVNFDDKLHSLIHQILGQKKILYFDLPFIQTTLSLFEIMGLFLAVFTSFYILREEQKDSKKRTELTYQPFIKPSTVIVFNAYDDDLSIELKNIGTGPALFTRVSFVKSKPDNPENATLKLDQPHSQYLSHNETSSVLFDPRHFYSFITKTKRGGDLGSDSTNYNNRSLRKELNDLIKARVNQDFYIYIHSLDILGNQMIFKTKYLLCLEYDNDDHSEFILKRMEIQKI